MNSNSKEIAREYENKVWHEKDFSAIDKLVHENVIVHSLAGDLHGAKAIKEVVQNWLKVFPDLAVAYDFTISENDIVSIKWRAKGTHQSELNGKRPTGKTVSYEGVTLYRIKNDKIIEYWSYFDMQHLLSQIQ